MDFFRQQDQARSRTGLLIFYFVVAVVLIVLVVNVLAFMLFATGDDFVSRYHHWMSNVYWEHPTALVVLLIFFGSLKRFFALASGGRIVAEMVGARAVDMASDDKLIKRYINVVAEMSIASGVSMPDIYVMEHEKGINAFVAGYRPTEAVMVVTRGALDELSRDQLQGVVAHEFSHILNGDMRINIKLMSVLAGILTIGQFGRLLMDSGSSGRSRKGGGSVIIIGLVFLLIGYIGLFFGRLIKSAISRQREYLADASAVQFTRNPEGLAGALNKIKMNLSSGYLNSRRTEEISHMCFSSVMNIYFKSLLASHPPLEVRIHAIAPLFLVREDAKWIIEKRKAKQVREVKEARSRSQAVVDMIGNPDSHHLAYAAIMYQSLVFLAGYMKNDTGARAIVFSLLLSSMKGRQMEVVIKDYVDQECSEVIYDVIEKTGTLEKRQWLSLIDLVLPVLKSMNAVKKRDFIRAVDMLVKVDKRITVFEYVLLIIIKQHLNNHSEKIDIIKFHSFKHVIEDVRVLISLLVKAGRQSVEKKNEIFARAMKVFVSANVKIYPAEDCSLEKLAQAMGRLNALAPMLKKTLITVCADCVLDDGVVLAEEAELLRAVSESLDCPMPPLVTD